MKKRFLVLLIILCIFSLSSCKVDHFAAKESGFWTYRKISGTNSCHIMGLTEEGKQQETLVVPVEINGLKVTGFGCKYAYRTSPAIWFDNTKKIYFHNSEGLMCIITEMVFQDGTEFFLSSQNVYMMMLFWRYSDICIFKMS